MTYKHISIQPRTVAIGADVNDVDLASLNDETFLEIKHALHKHLVLFFHGQELGEEQHMALASRR